MPPGMLMSKRCIFLKAVWAAGHCLSVGAPVYACETAVGREHHARVVQLAAAALGNGAAEQPHAVFLRPRRHQHKKARESSTKYRLTLAALDSASCEGWPAAASSAYAAKCWVP